MKSLRMTSEQHDAWKARQARAYADQRAKADGSHAAAVNAGIKTAPNAAASSPPIQRGASLTVAHLVEPASKYHNKRTEGYASKKEAARAFVLRLMQEAGQIRNLREQTRWLLVPKQGIERAAHYQSDFDYEEWATDGWRFVVEDVKGVRTSEYVLKRKLMLFVHGISIRET